MTDMLRLDQQLCFRFYTVSRLITQAYGPLLAQLGITYPQYLVLLVLWEQDGLPVNDIAKRLYLETNTVTPLLKRMETEGLVERHRDKEDARKVLVSLTAKGKDLKQEARCIPEQMSSSYSCNALSPEAIPGLIDSLDSLIDTLK